MSTIESQMAAQIVTYIHDVAAHRRVDMEMLHAMLTARLFKAPEPELHVDGVKFSEQLQQQMQGD